MLFSSPLHFVNPISNVCHIEYEVSLCFLNYLHKIQLRDKKNSILYRKPQKTEKSQHLLTNVKTKK